jgi:hypothetical protein
MTQSSGFFDPGGYTRAQIAAAFGRFLGNGYIPGYLYALNVYQHTAPDMSVNVNTGGCAIEGYWHISDAVVNLAIEAADATHPRIDRIVARLTTTGSPGSIVLAVLKGTAQTPAVAPTRTWASPTYELVLADVLVVVGTTAITTAMITDKRADDTLCGAARPAYVGKTAAANVAMAGFKLTGCANPSGVADGDNKGARDAAILVAVPSQAGHSGKFLSTNGTVTSWQPQGAVFKAIASDTLATSRDTEVAITTSAYTLTKLVTTPQQHIAGGVYRVKFTLRTWGSIPEHAYAKIYVNGIVAGTERHQTHNGDAGPGYSVEYSEDLTIAAAGPATIAVWCYRTGESFSYLSNFRVYCTDTVPWT